LLHRHTSYLYFLVAVALPVCPRFLFAQFIAPSGGNPVAVACPRGPTSGAGIDPLQAWRKGQDVASIEGDGFLGIGNWGHTEEALSWYCKASAAGSAFAAYDIAEIFRDGYVVNSNGPGGRIVTKHYLADLPTAFYWYQLSANRKYTRSMLAVAQFYALGDEILKGSHVPKDAVLAMDWLNRAAKAGDSTALAMLALRHAGRKTAPWGMALPIEPDTGKAIAEATLAIKLFHRYSSECTNPGAVKDMIDNLPDASEGRKYRSAALVEVHGNTIANPFELDCVLSLSAPPPSQQDEPTVDQFYRLIHGGAVNSWEFALTQTPGASESTMHRETATQAMVEGIEEISVLLQLLASSTATLPAGSRPPVSQPLAPARQQVDLTGKWRMRMSDSPNDTETADFTIKVTGDSVTIWMLGGTLPSQIFKGKFTSNKSIVGHTMPSNYEETLTITDPNHLTLSDGGVMNRLDAASAR
jgi:Sel1 repeat